MHGQPLGQADRWILTRATCAAQEVGKHLDASDHGLAAQKIYDFAWSEFCDWYIELAKADLFGEDVHRKQAVQAVLYHVLEVLLKMLHPFMPFLTEEVYRLMPGHEQDSCMLSSWPVFTEELLFPQEERDMEGVMEIIRAVRNLRAELKVQPGHRARLLLRPQEGWQDSLRAAEGHFQRLASASSVELLQQGQQVEGKIVSAVCPAAEVLIPLGDLVDLDQEIARLKKEYVLLQTEIERAEGKLNNPGFVNKAPTALVAQERQKLEERRQMIKTLEKRLQELES
ncbi:MAG: class I tRNA ligase family protein [Clostridiales bacterium]|nr:class I tRNA ligase family protein [Clostridiales bacterium]